MNRTHWILNVYSPKLLPRGPISGNGLQQILKKGIHNCNITCVEKMRKYDVVWFAGSREYGGKLMYLGHYGGYYLCDDENSCNVKLYYTDLYSVEHMKLHVPLLSTISIVEYKPAIMSLNINFPEIYNRVFIYNQNINYGYDNIECGDIGNIICDGNNIQTTQVDMADTTETAETIYTVETANTNMETDSITVSEILSTHTQMNNVNIMDIIEVEDRNLLENKRISSMSRIDWGKTMAVSNQYIQRNILRHMLSPYGYTVYSTDDNDFPDINIKNNSPGFDLVVISPEGKCIRVQSKLRQVKGVHDYSQQIHFETTRRNSEKNKDKNHTGHICYSLDEFDFVMISLVNDRINRDKIKNCDMWSYSLIPIKELEDKEHKCCYSHIAPDILKKNIVKIDDDIRDKFM